MVFQTFQKLLADLAVKDLVHMVIVREQERKAQSSELRAVGSLLAGGEHHGIEVAHLDHLDHLGVGTELLGGEDLDLHAAFGALFDGLGKVLKGDVNEVLGGVAVTDADGVGLVCRKGGDAHRADHNQCQGDCQEFLHCGSSLINNGFYLIRLRRDLTLPAGFYLHRVSAWAAMFSTVMPFMASRRS